MIRTPPAIIEWLVDEGVPFRLTLLILLLRPPGEGAVRGLTWLTAALALAIPALTRQAWTWLTLAALVLVRLAQDWPLADNHIYLLAYWLFGLGLCMLVRVAPLDRTAAMAAMAAMSRRLIGSAFLCAVVWKGILAPDFLDARFFRVTLVTDERFADLARHVGGLSEAQLAANRAALVALPSGAELLDGPVLVEPPSLRRLGLALTWGGFALETVLAAAFLCGWPPALYRSRDVLLIGFAVVTYAAAPVAGFGWLLTAMGLAQCAVDRFGVRLAYVAAFFLVLIYAETPLVHQLLSWAGG